MLVDSHCHLDRVNLEHYQSDFSRFVQATREAEISHMLCVSIDLERYPAMLALVSDYPDISVSAGVHPSDKNRHEPTVEELVCLAEHPKNVAIGETGLDYFHGKGDLTWQRHRFRCHIRAARAANKPLIIHSREAREDTLRLMTDENARDSGGVMHCFTENWDMARAVLDLNFYISFSGIVTFNSASILREVAKKVPIDRLLIETDSPYLAPAPHRGKPNEPKYLVGVAETIAGLHGVSTAKLAKTTSDNFFRLFKSARKPT